MNKEIKAEWVRRLREPGRKQGHGQLRDAEGGQCCLDVLNEQAADDDVQSYPVLNSAEGRYYYPNGSYLESGVLTDVCLRWAWLGDTNPYVSYNGAPRGLSALNDGERLSLPEIADVIEADEDL